MDAAIDLLALAGEDQMFEVFVLHKNTMKKQLFQPLFLREGDIVDRDRNRLLGHLLFVFGEQELLDDLLQVVFRYHITHIFAQVEDVRVYQFDSISDTGLHVPSKLFDVDVLDVVLDKLPDLFLLLPHRI